MSAPRKILWVVPKWPLPADDGARVATSTLLRETSRGADTDLLAIVPRIPDSREARAARLELGVREIHVAMRPNTTGGPWRFLEFAKRALLHPSTPLTVVPYSGSSLRSELRSVLRERAWDFTVLDGLHGAAALPLDEPALHARLGKLVYRAHNVEADLWAQSRDQARIPLKRAVLARQARQFLDFETRIARECALVLPVSPDDAARFRAIVPEGPRIETLPIGHDFNESRRFPPPPEKTLRLLFVGSLGWEPNRQGLEWFLNEVWPEAVRRKPKIELDIAGSGNGGWLARHSSPGIVRLHGRVETLAPLYERCAIAIAPIFLGSGTRVKAIDAARHRRACLSTALGVQGLGLSAETSYFQAETRDQWLAQIERLTSSGCARAGDAAFEVLAQAFDAKAVGERFQALLATLSTDAP